MRVATIGLVGGALLLAALFYLGLLDRSPAHIAALVPGDMRWGVFYRSIDDLRGIYEGPMKRTDVDTARLRIGEPINAPDLNGIAQQVPVGSYRNDAGEEIFVVPFFDLDAYEDAHESRRENILLRAPERVAANYFSVSASSDRARRGTDHPLVLRAIEFPMSVAGHPADGRDLRAMLLDFFGRESLRVPPGIVPLWAEVQRLPASVGDAIARAAADFILGVIPGDKTTEPPHFEIRITPAKGGVLERALPIGKEFDLAETMRALPVQTVLFVGGALDGAGWRELGLPWETGDARILFSIIHSRHRARHNSLLIVIEPRDPTVLEGLDARLLLGDPTAAGEFQETEAEDGTRLRTTRLSHVPDGLESLLRSDQREPPPVYLSTASTGGVWYAAVGAWAEDVVRKSIDCRRGRTELSIRAGREFSAFPDLFQKGPLIVAAVTVEGLAAFRYPMPYVDMASIGQPTAAALTLHSGTEIETNIEGKVRLTR